MNIIMWMIIMFYMLFPERLRKFVMEDQIEQPKDQWNEY